MKCPKCEYLGFETGDRCKNCGYDFSLAVTGAAGASDADLPLREAEPFHRDADRWLNQLEARLDTVRPAAGATSDPVASMPLASPPVVRQIAPRDTPNLPLFHPGSADLDEPLIKVPSAPRAPLSVRRTPERPKLRTMPKPVNRIFTGKETEPVLAFAEEPAVPSTSPSRRIEAPAPAQTPPATSSIAETSGPARRITAAVVDLAILLTIDAVVVYFTFQIAGLPFSDWQSVPIVPMALFLLMVKGSYFSVFTALGGQTVGKMAMGIRVVAENDREVEPSRAVQRTLAALASVATAGIGFAPVLFAGDRRALHDRVAGTRVVGPHHE